MFGAVIGDIIGSNWEGLAFELDTYDFTFFPDGSNYTDDTVCTVAIADALLNHKDIAKNLVDYCKRYPNRGYGGRFAEWIDLPDKTRKPYHSFGNGSAMRVSAAGWLGNSEKDTLKLAENTAKVTHNHPEGIKGAQSVAMAIFLARNGESKSKIKDYVESNFGYNLTRDYQKLCLEYYMDGSCQGSVPEAIIAFLASDSFEDAIRKAVWLKGDTDTQAAIAGSIAEAFYRNIPNGIKSKALEVLPEEFVAVLSKIETT